MIKKNQIKPNVISTGELSFNPVHVCFDREEHAVIKPVLTRLSLGVISKPKIAVRIRCSIDTITI